MACRDVILRYFVAPKYGGVQYKQGVEAFDLEMMAATLTKVRFDLAYLKSPNPKFVMLPEIRLSSTANGAV